MKDLRLSYNRIAPPAGIPARRRIPGISHPVRSLLIVLALVLLAAACSFCQTQPLGQVRILDFSPKTPCVLASGSSNASVVTTASCSLSTGTPVWIYQPWSVAQDAASMSSLHGNYGRGYYILSRTDATHFALSSEMYSGASVKISTIAPGDKMVPLSTYYVRQGPKLQLDGPISRGAWSGSTAYRSQETVTSGGNTYMAIADNTNQAPPNAAYWAQVNPALLGPGTFSASLRNTSSTGKAYAGAPIWQEFQSIEKGWWIAPSPTRTFDYDYGTNTEGMGGSLSALVWFANDDAPSYAAALRLATRMEDLAAGSVACSPNTGKCNRGPIGQDPMDLGRLSGAGWIQAIGAIYDTLSAAQKSALADRLLNDNDVTHNGIESNGGTNCTPMREQPVSAPISYANNVVTGSGFNALPDLQAGSALLFDGGGGLVVIGRVASKVSDTRLNLEPGATVMSGSPSAYYYTHPFGYGGEHTCGVIYWFKHYPSSPRMIPSQVASYTTDYLEPATNMDDGPSNNRTFSAMPLFIGAGLLLCNDDLRGCRLAEQAINYYMSLNMAAANKSKNTGFNGHGTLYGPGRVEVITDGLALTLKNSLTVTPPGVADGVYNSHVLMAYQYSPWLAAPNFVAPWDSGYGADGSQGHGQEDLLYIIGTMLTSAVLYPNDPFAPATWDYFRNRRGDFANFSYMNGWGAVYNYPAGWELYDPAATATAPAGLPLQAAMVETDANQCIAAGLYCRPDIGESEVISMTGWGNTDTQVVLHGQSAVPIYVEDNYGEAGSVEILQNNTNYAGTAYLLGGNGIGSSGYGSGLSASSGLSEGNTLSVFDGTTDLYGNPSYANVDRWAGDPVSGLPDNSYVYARVNLFPKIRNAAGNYTTGAATQVSFFGASAKPGPTTSEVVHFKSGSGNANYVVVYDSIAAGTANQLRRYWHYEITDKGPVRRPSWVTTFDTAKKAVVLTNPGGGRLSSKFLSVPGSANANIAIVRQDTAEAWCQGTDSGYNPEAVCTGNYAPHAGIPYAAHASTYRVTLCASSNGTSCDAETSAEWISIHKPSISGADTMPGTDQPPCTGNGANCTALEIQDSAYPKVAVFARRGALLRGVSFTSTHAGKAHYVVSGLVAGAYNVTVNGAAIVSAVRVVNGDSTLAFYSTSGAVSIFPAAPAGRGGVIRQNPGSPSGASPAARARASSTAPTVATDMPWNTPTGVAVTPAGSLYIADRGDHRIRAVSNGVIATFAGVGAPGFSGDQGPATEAQLDSPMGVAVDRDGNVYIADTGNHRVRMVSNGVITTVAGAGAAGSSGDRGLATDARLDAPTGVAVDAAGNLYICDAGDDRVEMVSHGDISIVAGTGSPGFSGDWGRATDAQLNNPMGVAVDGAGNVYIADTGNHRVRMVSNGMITTVAGAGAAGWSGDHSRATDAELNSPTGLAIGGAGELYIADTGNHGVRVVSGGDIAWVAGTPAMEWQTPFGLAIDAAGSLYVTDAGLRSTRRISGGLVIPVADIRPPAFGRLY